MKSENLIGIFFLNNRIDKHEHTLKISGVVTLFFATNTMSPLKLVSGHALWEQYRESWTFFFTAESKCYEKSYLRHKTDQPTIPQPTKLTFISQIDSSHLVFIRFFDRAFWSDSELFHPSSIRFKYQLWLALFTTLHSLAITHM